MNSLLPLLLATSLSAGPAIEPLLRLDAAQDGSTQRVPAGARFTVELVSDAGGTLRWDLIEPPIQHIVRTVGPVETATAGDKRGLALRIQRWTFEAVGPGAQRLRFDQRRPGEARREPEAEHSFLIEVTAGGTAP